MRRLIESVSLIAMLATAQSAFSQDGYPEALLNQKGTFSQGLATALGETFRGVALSSGIIEGLFPVQTTGVSTAEIQAAGEQFLSLLDTAQLSRTQFAITDPEWRNWSNVDVGIFARHGISLEEMTQPQKDAAWNLLQVSLSAKGLALTRNIMKTEQTLLELNGEPIRYGEEKYYFTMMGIPSATEPWGWQLDGHHLVINYFVMGDQVVMTPTFMGGEPIITTTGKYAGNTILQDEQNLGLAFMTSLNARQRSQATINAVKTRNQAMAAANEDNMTLDYQGLRGADLDTVQQTRLLELIQVYVGNLRDDQGRLRMAEVAAHISDTHFAWVGAVDDDAVFYYRIHSPVILIEFDHQNPVGTLQINTPGTPTRDHIHTVIRTPNGNDYGKDLLRQHLQNHRH